MKLELNKHDQKANLKDLKKEVKRTIFGATTTLMLFSGCLVPEKVAAQESQEIETMFSLDNIDPNMVVEIPDTYKFDVASACNKNENDQITAGDLTKIEGYSYFAINDDSSLKWLNYCSNITDLMLIIKTDNTDILKEITGLEKISSLDLLTYENLTINSDDFAFMKNCPNLKSFSFTGFHLEPGFIESFDNLEYLGVDSNYSYELNYNNLTFLDELSFNLENPYDIAIGLNSEEYQNLLNNGVTVDASDMDTIEKVKEINSKLDNIVASLNLTENSTTQEKLDAILIYTLDNLTYDKEVSDALANNKETKDLAASFYQGGHLYGALEKESAICGNYAALVSALSDRVGIDSYILKSDTHAWNLVNVEDENYYIDATWLDGKTFNEPQYKYAYDENGENKHVTEMTFKKVSASESIHNQNTEILEWYMEDPTNFQEIENDNSHEVINLPSFIELKPIEEQQRKIPDISFDAEEATENIEKTKEKEEIEDITNKKFEVTIGDRKWVIVGGVAVGLLTALGGAVLAIHKKTERKRKNFNRQLLEMELDNHSPYGVYNSFNNNSSPKSTNTRKF